MARTYAPNTLKPYRLNGLSYTQSLALRRIDTLKRDLADRASVLGLKEMGRITDECYRLIKTHFAADWQRIQTKAALARAQECHALAG